MRAGAVDSLFFAIHPDENTGAAIASRARELCAAHGLRGRPIAVDRLHITLHFLGEFPGVPADVVDRASDVATSVKAGSFEIGLDRAMSFAGNKKKRPFVLGSRTPSPGLAGFQKSLHEALRKAGLRNQLRGFTPHLTLLYDEQHVREQAIDPIRWTVREFVLVHSLVGRGRHETLARWPLTD